MPLEDLATEYRSRGRTRELADTFAAAGAPGRNRGGSCTSLQADTKSRSANESDSTGAQWGRLDNSQTEDGRLMPESPKPRA